MMNIIGRYALRFREVVDPIVDAIEAQREVEQLNFQEQEWEFERLQRLKEEEERRMDEDDEVFYEVVK
jgi:hypothetical protein